MHLDSFRKFRSRGWEGRKDWEKNERRDEFVQTNCVYNDTIKVGSISDYPSRDASGFVSEISMGEGRKDWEKNERRDEFVTNCVYNDTMI